jgi:hypothetical protein
MRSEKLINDSMHIRLDYHTNYTYLYISTSYTLQFYVLLFYYPIP